jgi:hypothetical protein
MAVEALNGRPVLLILLSQSAPEVFFIPGVAEWDVSCGQLSIAPDTGGSSVRISASRETLRGFDPAVLSQLIVAEHRDAVLALARAAEACVAVFSDQRPVGASAFRQPFFGVGGNARTGEVFLFRGADDVPCDDDAADDEDAPWADTWEPDAPAT